MAYTPIQVAPGIFSDDAPATTAGRYVASDMVRFHRGQPQIIGGYQLATGTAATGTVRKLLQWSALDGTELVALASEKRLMILEGGIVTDITPAASTGTLLSNPFAMTSGSATVTVTHATHGAAVGQEVDFTSATATAGISADALNLTHTIVSVPDVNSYTITVSSNASSSASGGGTPGYTVLLAPGFAVSTNGFGFGAGAYGVSTWDTVRAAAAVTFSMRLWSLALWGEDLLAVADDVGTVVRYDTSAGGRATTVSGPPACEQIAVLADSRQLVCFSCAGDKMRVDFSDKGDLSDFTASATDSAGSLNIAGGSEIIAVAPVSGRAVAIVTDEAFHEMSFIGGDLVMRVRRVGNTPAPLGANAIIESDGQLLYAVDGGVMQFAGGRLQQLPCPIAKSVFDDMDLTNRRAVQAGRNAEFNEWTFSYPTTDAAGANDKCLVWHASEAPAGMVWSTNTLALSGWTDRTVGSNPLSVHPTTGAIYEHETGTSAAGQPIVASLTTGDTALPDGSIYTLSRVLPDFVIAGSDSLSLTLRTRIAPLGVVTTSGPHTIASGTTVVNTRATGRFIAYTLSSNSSNLFWRGGTQAVEIEASGAQR